MYMQDADFDSILMLAGERPDIGVFLSSTPTGARKRFWQCCTDPKMHFKEFHFPSMCNPDWGPEMEEEFRAQLSEAGYTHEVLAEFGEQETGVFNKDRLDEATRYFYYTYDKLTMSQQRKIEENDIKVADYVVPYGYSGVYRPNIFRTMGIDWDCMFDIVPPGSDIWAIIILIAGTSSSKKDNPQRSFLIRKNVQRL